METVQYCASISVSVSRHRRQIQRLQIGAREANTTASKATTTAQKLIKIKTGAGKKQIIERKLVERKRVFSSHLSKKLNNKNTKNSFSISLTINTTKLHCFGIGFGSPSLALTSSQRCLNIKRSIK